MATTPARLHEVKPRSEMQQVKAPDLKRVRNLLGKIVKVCEYGDGESGTEAFLVALGSAVRAVEKEVRASHKAGLCLDCTTALAYKLLENEVAA